MRVIVHPRASREAADAFRWYAERRVATAVRFRETLRLAIDRIRRMPQTWPLREGVRIARLRRFPYHLVYHLLEGHDALLVVAIAHDKRRPGYWRRRL